MARQRGRSLAKRKVCELYSQLKSDLAMLYSHKFNFSISKLKEMGKDALFLAKIAPLYPDHFVCFLEEIIKFLQEGKRFDITQTSQLRFYLVKALILLINRTEFDLRENLVLFVELRTDNDPDLEKLAIDYVVRSIKHMNQKHTNEAKNQELQNILFTMAQQEDEGKARRSLAILCDLYKRKVWFDDRTANAICNACLHPSSDVFVAALKFLLSYEKIEDDGDNNSEDEPNQQPQVLINGDAIYKAHHEGTLSRKKNRQAKLQREISGMKRQHHLLFMLQASTKKKRQAKFQLAIRSMKKQQLLLSGKNATNHYSPLNYLKDAQGFAEKMFSHLDNVHMFFATQEMALKVISRTMGLYRLVLPDFYPNLHDYVQPFQNDITGLLAAVVQTCHEKVPPEAVKPLLKHIVNEFVHDFVSRTEIMAVGLNVVREICIRMPSLMTEDLLQDLVLYRKWKSRKQAVSVAARSLITLFREVRPSLAIRKTQRRPTDPQEKHIAGVRVLESSNVPGAVSLDDNDDEDADARMINENAGKCGHSADEEDYDDGSQLEDDKKSEQFLRACDNNVGEKKKKAHKRKFTDFEGQPDVADKSVRPPKGLAGEMTKQASPDEINGIHSDVSKIELKIRKTERPKPPILYPARMPGGRSSLFY